jgi:phospholipid/cholesterol/gamma-HCH transport system substrate-binding protein
MNSMSYIKIALFFVVLGGAGAVYVVMSSNGISPVNTKVYEVVFYDASGLSTRSKVYLAGVQVGKVKGIELYGTEAHIKIMLHKDVELRQDAVLSRKPSSLLGTSVLSLDPGTELTPVIPPGSRINSAPPSGDINAAMGLVQEVGGQVNLLLNEFRTNQMALLAVSLETFNSIASRVDAQSEAQLDYISSILESVALIAERTERLLADSEGDISGSVSDIHGALANIRTITGEIAGGRGNLGQALYDENLYASILATAEKTEDAAGKLGEALGSINALAKDTNVVVNNAGEIVNKALGLGIQVDTNGRYDILAKTVRAAASIRLEPASNDRWYRLGVSSAPDGVASRTVKETTYGNGTPIREDTTETRYTVAVDAELARRFGMLTFRGGLLESSAGLGIDVSPFSWLSLSGEVFNFKTGEPPNLRSSLTFYPFFNPDSDKPWNWIYLRGGINDALRDNRDYFFGGGFRFADREIKGLVGLAPVFNN